MLLFEDILRNLFYERYLNVKMRQKLLLITSKRIELLLSLKKCRISCLKFFLVCIFVNLSYSSSTVFSTLILIVQAIIILTTPLVLNIYGTYSDSPILGTPIVLSFNKVKIIHVIIFCYSLLFYINVHINFLGSQFLSGLVMIPKQASVPFL